jgi:beta-glucosidase
MSLDATDLNTINTLRNAGVPVVVVLVSGRPLDVAAQLPQWNALVAAWLPGSEGQGVADVLFGVAQPTGKLPMTWMSSASQQPINDGDGKVPLFPLGFGLSYGAAPTRDAYAVIEAESFGTQAGVQLEATTDVGGGQNVGFIAPGDSITYPGVNFGATTALRVLTRRASGSTGTGTVQYRLDSATGPIIASVPISNTGGWQSWGSVTTNLSASVTGVHAVVITFTGAGLEFVNLNWFQFAR